jgi:DNA-binding LacI/PurR family transcriptional regulator
MRGDPRIAANTRRRVTEAAQELGYDPAAERTLSKVAGIVTATGLDDSFRDPFQLQLIAGISDGLRTLGMCVLFVPPYGTPGHDQALSRIPLDVCFLIHGFSTYASTRASLERRGVPVLVLEAEADDPDAAVRTNEADAYRSLIEAVLEAGHTSAAVVALPLSHHEAHRGLVDVPDLRAIEVIPTRERLEVMVQTGLAMGPVFESTHSNEVDGELAARAFLELPVLPTAIVCHSDVLAAGVVRELRKAGLRVPQDVSVTGFDGLDLPTLAPLVLTTVTQDPFQKGRLLAEQARALLLGDSPQPALMHLTMRAGNSVAAPRATGGGL